jgi:hypothetical protein
MAIQLGRFEGTIRFSDCVLWEGSTTVIYTVVWRNFVVWCTRVNTALWLAKNAHSLEIVTGHIQYLAFLDQSQRRIYPGTSNYGISPYNSGLIYYSGWPLPVFRCLVLDFWPWALCVLCTGTWFNWRRDIKLLAENSTEIGSSSSKVYKSTVSFQ